MGGCNKTVKLTTSDRKIIQCGAKLPWIYAVKQVLSLKGTIGFR